METKINPADMEKLYSKEASERVKAGLLLREIIILKSFHCPKKI